MLSSLLAETTSPIDLNASEHSPQPTLHAIAVCKLDKRRRKTTRRGTTSSSGRLALQQGFEVSSLRVGFSALGCARPGLFQGKVGTAHEGRSASFRALADLGSLPTVDSDKRERVVLCSFRLSLWLNVHCTVSLFT